MFSLRCKNVFLLLVLTVSTIQHTARAQGINTTFGQNRVQYGRFDWLYLRAENFDAYYYTGGKELATFCVKYAENHLTDLENLLEHRLSGRVEIICYNTMSDFKQSNIDLEDLAQNTGGYAQVNSNKVFVYFTGDHADLVRQMKEGLSMVIINEILYGGNLQERLQNAALLSLPEWFLRGLTAYISRPWDSELDNKMKDGVMSGKYKKFNRLSQKDAVFAGHSLWKYMGENSEAGTDIIKQIIIYTKLTRNYESAIYYTMDRKPFKQVQKEWYEYYRNLYSKEDENRKLPVVELKVKRRLAPYIEPQMKAGPKGDYVAFTTNKNGKYKVWLVDTKKGRHRKILKGGLKYYQLELDHSFPLIAWEPGGDRVGMIYEKKGKIILKRIDLVNNKKEYIEFSKFDKITGFDFSDNGRTIVLSAIRKGQSDIYTFDIPSRREKQLTFDFYDDQHPHFVQGSSQIAFSSNRLSDSLGIGVNAEIGDDNNYDIFVYDLELTPQTRMMKRLTRSAYINETQPTDFRYNYIAYLSDYNGIKNRYVSKVEEEYDFTEVQLTYFDYTGKTTDTIRYVGSWPFSGREFKYLGRTIVLDSTLEKVDTIVHNKDIVTTYPMSNYPRSIAAHDVSLQSRMVYDLVLQNNRYFIKISPLPKQIETESKTIETYPNMFRLKSGVANKPFEPGSRIFRSFGEILNDTSDGTAGLPEPTEVRISQDTSAYFFISEFTPDTYKRPAYVIVPKILNNDGRRKLFKISSPQFYNLTFFADQVVTQIDNSIINTYYQPISPAASQMFNPGLTGMFKLGMIDLMEDYRFTGGLRFALDLNGFDFFASFETLKNRFDHKLLFYRQSRSGGSTETNNKVTSLSHELRYIVKYPFNPASSLRMHIFGRQDKDIFKASDNATLLLPDRLTWWGGGKLEYVYDNVIPKGLNLYNGTRLKLFYEKYVNLDNSDIQLNVLGFDVRHYERIHRQIVWCSRITANTSFGPAKVVYYLGGVENWLTPRFNNDYSTAQDQNYIFQALACNLRGFEQNIRNGNSFALASTEVRFPVFQYAFNRPLRSEFLNNFQLVPFFDIGTAWIGSNPYSDENTFNQKIIEVGPVKAKVINVRDPLVAGFGGGLRSKLLGYFIRFDVAWGIQDAEVNSKPVYYIGLGLDF